MGADWCGDIRESSKSRSSSCFKYLFSLYCCFAIDAGAGRQRRKASLCEIDRTDTVFVLWYYLWYLHWGHWTTETLEENRRLSFPGSILMSNECLSSPCLWLLVWRICCGSSKRKIVTAITTCAHHHKHHQTPCSNHEEEMNEQHPAGSKTRRTPAARSTEITQLKNLTKTKNMKTTSTKRTKKTSKRCLTKEIIKEMHPLPTGCLVTPGGGWM